MNLIMLAAGIICFFWGIFLMFRKRVGYIYLGELPLGRPADFYTGGISVNK